MANDLELEPELNREKFLAVVHYVCDRCDPAQLGRVKLHKILYFLDMFHYMSTGKAVTGVTYKKQQFGPVALHLSWALDELCKDGFIEVQTRDYFGFQKIDFISKMPAEVGKLSNQEVSLLNDVISFVCSFSAKEISEISHDAPWESANMGETIPYFTAFGMFPTELTEEDIRLAVDEARTLRPLIGA